MFRKLFVFALLFCASLTVRAEPNELLKTCLETKKKLEELQKKSSDATTEERNRLGVISSLKYILSKGITPEQKAQHKKSLEDNRKQLDYVKAQIKKYELLVKMSELSKEAQKAKADEFKKEERALQDARREKEKPFRDEMSKINNDTKEKVKEFGELLKKYFRTSPDFPEITKVALHASFQYVTSVSWMTADNKQAFWCHVRIYEKPSMNSRMEKLAGKYPVSNASSGQIWLYAGHFNLAFIPSASKYKNEETLKKAVQALVDLEKLAAMKAE